MSWEAFMHVELSVCPLGRTQVRQSKALSAAEPACGGQLWLPNPAPESGLSALEGSFGRRRCRRTCMSFVSGGNLRPPKVPPKVHDFRLWRDFRPPNLPPKVPCSAFLCMFCMIVLRFFRGFLGDVFRVMF